ncbi:TIGR01777 family oxidoreductase [Aeromicrobium chenweiae]|uniref:TIGR01777 family protein n=1 Tax=Aeromicrobium chenweiae TaxID=2079793 RepID=A0A2S0WPH6_9ACTN|nr:TIGR01777 family oxidoreductase [Aeromicrobium chenweiae]AWB93180.1 TIGR01777 family protein [Aeromicrobium chenweiae]TGN34170.1 TIGR01777 family protein [Aeromicrobium chenweiae]
MGDLRTAVIAGASGYVGTHVREHLEARGVAVRTIGRGEASTATWDDPDALVRAVDGADLVLNLAGRSVSCRYSRQNTDEIFRSRVGTTAALGRAVAAAASPPSLWVNASTGTIYRDARDRPMDEVDGEIGSGLSVEVARAWERELFAAPTSVRRVALRMTIVLGAGGGAINPFINLARIGFGGRMGDGAQRFSWVHVEDVARSIVHLHGHPELSGPVNVAAPEVVMNAELMRRVRTTLGRRRGLPEPQWLLEMGARIIRTEAELVLKSRWVASRALVDSGFVFEHETLQSALDEIAGRTPRGLLPVALG